MHQMMSWLKGENMFKIIEKFPENGENLIDLLKEYIKSVLIR